MEVVCVSLPGYIIARQGMFDADKQKFLANLNVALFTPCLSMCSRDHMGGGPKLICSSLYETGIAIDCGNTVGSRGYSRHFRHTNGGFVLGIHLRIESISIKEEAGEFCNCHGSEFNVLPVFSTC